MDEVPAGRLIRVRYAHCSTARQELASQLTALEEAGCTRIFSEKISTPVSVRPELKRALGPGPDAIAQPNPAIQPAVTWP
jgi:Resolvase, N terminal domain